MATLPANDELLADTLPDFVLIRTDQIDQGDRLRAIDPVWAEALGQVMLREGQRTPIEVCRLPGKSRWTLVSGGHRLAGAESAGIVHLRAEIVSADRTDRKMREVSENLWRRDLDPIDRAAFIAELVSLRRAAAGLEAAAFRDASVPLALKKRVDAEIGETLETISSVYGFTDEIGAELGFTGRTIRNDLMLYRGLAPSLIDQLRRYRHPILRNASQLRALAKLEGDEQSAVVDRLTGANKPLNEVFGGIEAPKTVAAALASIHGERAAPDADTKRLSAFIGAFQRMGLAEKKGALAHLAGMMPAGFSLVEEGADAARRRDDAIEVVAEAIGFLDALEEDEIVQDVERAGEMQSIAGRLVHLRIAIEDGDVSLLSGGRA